MRAETVVIKTNDGVSLKGFIYKSKIQTKKILISIHGMATGCIKKRDEKIAQALSRNGMSMLVFNNRGHDIISYIKKEKVELAGTAYEEISECYEDILGAINFAIGEKYDEIYLMGHSLGATKVVYFYNKLIKEKNEVLKKIKAIILLSLVDVPKANQIYLQNKFSSMVTYAKNMKKDGMENILMPMESFIHPISVKNFLRYNVENEDINFARFSDETYEFIELNNIKIPLFMRWGNNGELILQKADELCEFLQERINNSNLDIGYIEGADHSYTDSEEILARAICEFLKNSK